jgi:hypothetical protein
MSDPRDPRSLSPPQQIALLTLLGGELAEACISRLRADGAPSPSEMDYIALAQASLSMRYSGNRRALTPIGRYRATDLAKAIARASSMHVVTYGEGRGFRFVKCSCGEFFASHATRIAGADLKVMRAGGRHLEHVERRSAAPQEAH